MPRVVSHSDVERVAPGGTLAVEADAVVTPFAEEQARARGVVIARGGLVPPAAATVRQVARQVAARLPDASPEVLEAVVAEVVRAAEGAQLDGSSLVEVG